VLTVGGVIRSETTKLWTLRSPSWLVGAIMLVPIALGMARAAVAPPEWNADATVGVIAALEASAVGALPAAFLAAVLGLIAMGAERTDDAISATFAAVPRRRLVVLAKCLPAAGAAMAASLIGLALAAILAVVVLGARGYGALPVGTMAAVVVGGAVAVALVSVLGVASAALTRSVSTAAIQLLGLLAVAPTVIGIAGGRSAQWLTDLLPATAIQAVVTRPPAVALTIEGAPPSSLGWPAAMLVLAAWASGLLAVALVRIGHTSASGRWPRPRPRTSARAEGRGRPALGTLNVLGSEALKLRTSAPVWWCLGLTTVATVAIALLRASIVRPDDVVPGALTAEDLVSITADEQAQTIAGGIGLAQLLLATAGALVFTSEFGSGSIGPTLLAAPRRTMVFLVKVGVVTLTAGLVSALGHGVAALVATPIQHRQGFASVLSAPIVFETVLRCTVASLLVTAIGCAAGALLRLPVASVAALVGVFVLSHSALGPLQTAAQGTPLVWVANVDEFFPSAVVAVQPIPDDSWWPQFLVGDVLQLDPGQSMGVLAAWAVLSLGIALLVFQRRRI
jgi:ABC-2 type transport system permease protein